MNGTVLRRCNPLVNLFVVLALLPVAAFPTGAVTAPDRHDYPAPQLAQSFGQLPLYFVENRGQTDPRVAYYLLGGGAQVWFRRDGVTLALPDQTSRPSTPSRETTAAEETGPTPQRRWAVKVDFVDANPAARIEAEEQQEAIVSYFKGSPGEWQAGLRTYARVVYRDLWPGIDLAYYGSAGRLKYDFVVHPGADPAQIRLRYRGADGVTLNRAGQMEVSTPAGGFTDDVPVAWQDGPSGRTPVIASFDLLPETSGHVTDVGNEAIGFRFRLSAYDPSRTLVLDPVVFLYCGYIGGAVEDRGGGIAVDSAGNAYVTGYTYTDQMTFPVVGGPDLTQNGERDAFVAKVNAAGTALLYAGYIGGAGQDEGRGIAVDGAGNAYVTGGTTSTEATFPVIGGPDPTYNGGDYSDAFVAKVSPSGAMLVYAGYIGGSGSDSGSGIAVDSAGAAYVTGGTSSNESTFPVTVGPDLTYNDGSDTFVVKVNPAGTALVYAGYIGGSSGDGGNGIAVDSGGNAYVTGTTYSSEVTFPAIGGPDLTYNGYQDAFVAKVNPSGAALVYAGYIGGSGHEFGNGIAVDSAGNAYVAGMTWGGGFPAIVGPDLTYGGSDDAFVAKVSASGATLAYVGYIGGSDRDQGFAIAVNGAGNAYVTGITGSTEASFPVTVGPDLTYNGGDHDTFVAKVSSGEEPPTRRHYLPLVLRN